MGEVISVTEGTDIGEPMPFVLTGVNEEMVGNSVEEEEEHHRVQCLRVELKELLGGFFHVLGNCHDFRLIQ